MIKIPKEAFQEEGEEMMPEVGEEISLGSCRGVVKEVAKDGVVMDLKAINEVPVVYVEMRKMDEGENMDEEKEEMMKLARKADEEEGYA